MDPAGGVPRTKCSPHEMSDGVTTADDLFVIAYLGIPQVDQAGWSLAIDGLVDRPHTLKLDDLKSRPKRSSRPYVNAAVAHSSRACTQPSDGTRNAIHTVRIVVR